jgi:hypothetical protein
MVCTTGLQQMHVAKWARTVISCVTLHGTHVTIPGLVADAWSRATRSGRTQIATTHVSASRLRTRSTCGKAHHPSLVASFDFDDLLIDHDTQQGPSSTCPLPAERPSQSVTCVWQASLIYKTRRDETTTSKRDLQTTRASQRAQLDRRQ